MQDLYTVNDVIGGYYNLLAAVLELAQRDAKLDPEKYKDPKDRSAARRNREGAEIFLTDVESYRRSISAS